MACFSGPYSLEIVILILMVPLRICCMCRPPRHSLGTPPGRSSPAGAALVPLGENFSLPLSALICPYLPSSVLICPHLRSRWRIFQYSIFWASPAAPSAWRSLPCWSPGTGGGWLAGGRWWTGRRKVVDWQEEGGGLAGGRWWARIFEYSNIRIKWPPNIIRIRIRAISLVQIYSDIHS